MIENIISSYSLHIFKYVFPLILIPYLTRILGVSAWGELAIAQAFAAYLSLLIEYGFDLSATKKLAQCQTNLGDREQLLADVMGAKLILIIFAIIISIPFFFIIDFFVKDEMFFYGTLFFAVSSSFNLLWYFQGIERLVVASLIDTAIRVLGILSIFIWVNEPEDKNRVLFIYGFSSVLLTIILYFIINKDTKILFPSFKGAISSLKLGWNMFIYKISVSFYTTGNTLILSLFASIEVVAIYSAAEKICKAVLGLLSPITQVLFPRVSNLAKTDFSKALGLFKKSLILMVLIGLMMSIGVYIFSDILISIILGEEFISAIDILQVLAALPILIAVSNVLGIQWMLPNGMDKAFNKIIIVSGVFNLLLAFMLAPNFQALGMAWAVVIAESGVTFAMIFYLLNQKKSLYTSNIRKELLP